MEAQIRYLRRKLNGNILTHLFIRQNFNFTSVFSNVKDTVKIECKLCRKILAKSHDDAHIGSHLSLGFLQQLELEPVEVDKKYKCSKCPDSQILHKNLNAVRTHIVKEHGGERGERVVKILAKTYHQQHFELTGAKTIEDCFNVIPNT